MPSDKITIKDAAINQKTDFDPFLGSVDLETSKIVHTKEKTLRIINSNPIEEAPVTAWLTPSNIITNARCCKQHFKILFFEPEPTLYRIMKRIIPNMRNKMFAKTELISASKVRSKSNVIMSILLYKKYNKRNVKLKYTTEFSIIPRSSSLLVMTVFKKITIINTAVTASETRLKLETNVITATINSHRLTIRFFVWTNTNPHTSQN